MKKQPGWKKQFCLMSVGQIFSIVGSSAAQFAIIWWLTVATDSAVTLTLASLVGYLPQAILGPFVGAWVDRYDRKKIMMLADSFVAIVSGGLALAFAFDFASLWVIYLALFLRSVGSTFHGTAYQTVIPAFVPQDKLVKAGGWGQMVSSGASLLGPVLGAFLMGITSLEVIMLTDILGAMLAVGSLVFIRVPRIPASGEKISVLEDVKAGYRVMRKNKILMTVMPIIMVAVFFGNPIFSLAPLMVSRHFGGGVWHNSVVQLFMSIGVLLGAAILGMWGGNKKQFLMISITLLITGICSLAAGLIPGGMFVAFVSLMFLTGLVNSGINVPYTAYIQKTVEPHMMGKVLALAMTVTSTVAPLGFAVAGPAAEYFGVAQWYAISGAIIVATAVFMLIKSRGFDRQNDAEPLPAGLPSTAN